MADLNALVIFARVAELGSLSATARRIGMPLSTLSRKLADLEAELGVRLIERSTRQLRVTEVGQHVLDQARRGLDISEAVDAIVSQRTPEVRGRLRLSAPPSLSDTLLAPLIGAFQMLHPGVEAHVLVTDRLVDLIADRIDVALRVGPLEDSALLARPLLRYRHRLLASPAYLRRGQPQHPDELQGHRLLAFSHGARPFRWVFHAGAQTCAVTFSPVLAMNDYAGLAAALAAGGGIGELPALVGRSFVADGSLVEILPGWRFEPLDLSMVFLPNRHATQALQLFREFAVQTATTLFPGLST